MSWSPDKILTILDRCCDDFRFPMLDNGYVYLAATRLSLHRSETDWALVIEVFGFSPRAGDPDVSVSTFASRLHERDKPSAYVNQKAWEAYLANNPHNEYRSFFPLDLTGARPDDDGELLERTAATVKLRGDAVEVPSAAECEWLGVRLQSPPSIHVFELCRALAATHRSQVLALRSERRVSVLPEMQEVLVLDEWHHPNVVDADERPSNSEAFRQMAEVLVSGDVALYRPSQQPNTHWTNWPFGGTL
jgi:hypothetical protein